MQKTDYDVTIFCSSPARKLNSKLVQLLYEYGGRISISKYSSRVPPLAFILDKIPFVNLRTRALTKEIARGHDLVHYFEMQHSGYLLLPIIEKLRHQKIAYSNYGSDIFWFRRSERHVRKMSRVLSITNLVFYECERDIEFLVKECPKTCRLIWVVNSGGLKVRQAPISQKNRSVIAIKGYSNKWGMGVKAVYSVLRLRRLLKDRHISIFVYSANLHVAILSRVLSMIAGVKCKVYRKGVLTHDEVLQALSEALVHVALSKSDGVPSSTLEAMNQGALPIQSSSACMSRILENGSNGFLVSLRDRMISEFVRKAITDEPLRHRASLINQQVIRELFQSGDIALRAAVAYEELISGGSK